AVFLPAVVGGAAVRKGQVLGRTTDLLARPTGAILSPIDGLVVHMRGAPSITSGTAPLEVFPVHPELPVRRP
ncbi:MAG: hypothetical protein H7066_15945, partial [Cytophagaceae bacterium]|nr:hypothetical protein [Gemmatimonadaceae bacterium]